MKKYLIIAVAALAASVACTKTTLDPAAGTHKIAFEVASYTTQTKVLGSGGSLWDEGLTTTAFYTYGYFTPTSGTSNQTFMNNVQILPYQSDGTTAATAKTNTGIWQPAIDYFWPKTGTIDFFSYASKNAVTMTVGAGSADHRKTISFGTAGEPLTIASNDNILLADACYFAKESNAGSDQETITGNESHSTTVPMGVPTLFRHLLCQVKFDIQLKSTQKHVNTKYEVDITSASITGTTASGLKNNGYFTKESTAPVGTDLQIKDWGTSGNQLWAEATSPTYEPVVNFTATPSSLVLAVNSDGSEHTSGDAHVLLATRTFRPQEIAEDVKINLTYTVRAKHGDTTYSEETITITPVSLREKTSGNTWKMNDSWTYHIYIDPVTTTVTFDPAVVDWTAQNGTDITL